MAGDKRRYLKYLLGLFGTMGALIVSVYFNLIKIPLRGNGAPSTETSLTSSLKVEETTSRSRIPPGQYEVKELRVLHVGSIPKSNLNEWTFEAFGLVENPFVLSWFEFQELKEVESKADFHCVTGWTKLDNLWGGVKFKTIHEKAKPQGNVNFATIVCDGGYTTSLPITELLEDDVLLAYKLDGAQLDPKYGGPLRLVVPKKYAYKSAKWVRKIKFTEQQELGYWEVRGYSNTADPWTEDRYG